MLGTSGEGLPVTFFAFSRLPGGSSFRCHKVPVGPLDCSEHLVALPALARVAVMPAMGTKSRENIWGSQIRGAKMGAEKARQRATEAVRETDRAEAYARRYT